MKKRIYCTMMFALLFIGAMSVKSQVTIGSQNNPHAGAVLDLQSTTKGLLLPNVSLSNVNSLQVVSSPTAAQKVLATGMMVYNDNASVTGGSGVGVYVWDGSKWGLVSGSSTPVTVAVTSVSLNKSATSLIAGNTETLTATVSPTNATNKNVTWSSSNTGVATVSNGTITALSVGSAVITVTTADGNKTATCSVTVTAASVAVTGVSLNKSATTLGTGSTETLTATVSPTNATNKSVTWSSSMTSVATVSNGTITAVSVGSATITVTTVDGSKTASCSVTVTNADGSTTMRIGNNDYKTYVYKTNAGDDQVWMVQNSKEGTSSAPGNYYNLAQATQANNACPSGWRLPIASEWEALKIIVNADKNGVGKWWTSNLYGAFAGYCYGSTVNDSGLEGVWWGSPATYFHLYNSRGTLTGPNAWADSGWFTIRCVKN